MLQTTNNTLNKVRNELALHKEKRVLNLNMASSSNPSNPESQGTVSNGSQGKDGNGQAVPVEGGNTVEETATQVSPVLAKLGSFFELTTFSYQYQIESPVADFDDAPNANVVSETVKRTEQTLNSAEAFHSSSSLSPIESFSDEVIAQDTKEKGGKVKKSKKGKGKGKHALPPSAYCSLS